MRRQSGLQKGIIMTEIDNKPYLMAVLSGVAYSQLLNPGAPVIFGAFVTSIDMNSGAPTFGTPEASKILYGAGQLARRLGLPFRSGGALCGSKLTDSQSAYESANTLQAALHGGVNFMLHSCGWLEGGLVSSFEKFVMDADQLGALHTLSSGIDISTNGKNLIMLAVTELNSPSNIEETLNLLGGLSE